jgi:integrase
VNGVGSEQKARRQRKQKEQLESRSFREGAIYLFRRADYKKPTWFCRIKVPDAKGYLSCSTKTTDEHQAYAFAYNLYNKSLAQVAAGLPIGSKQTTAAIKEYVTHICEVDGKRASVIYRAQFLERVATFFTNIRVKEITTPTLFALTTWIRQNSRTGKLSPNTIKRYSTDLKQFFGWCVDKGYLDMAPRFPKLKGEHNRRPHFDATDWAKLLGCLSDFVHSDYSWVVRDRTMLVNYVLILANTGIRVGEARGLKWSDLKEIQAPNGSNQNPILVLYVKGKTGAREVVAATLEVKEYFKRILELRKNEIERLGEEFSIEDYVFCNRDGTAIGSFKKSFGALLRYAGVETDRNGNKRTIYSLRHTYATNLLEGGVHQFILAKNMGTRTAVLEKHYGHTSNVASAAELTKGSRINGYGHVNALEWLAK